MKIFIRIILAGLLVFFGLKFLLPYNAYPIEHFEQFLIGYFPFSWGFVAISSRVLVGLFFVFAFLCLFYWEKIKWMKYISILMIFIPFIINPVFPESFKDVTLYINEPLPFILENANNETVLIYVSSNCLHCKEALLELDVAQKGNANFSEIKVISYNAKIQDFIDEKQLDLHLEIISPELFLKITQGSFPKFQLVKANMILKKWSNSQFNYAVLDNLSK